MNQPPTKKQSNNLGVLGEKKAVSFLKKLNYQILETNYRYKHLELDVIALDRTADEIVFIEVKTRSHNWAGDPALAVNQKKLINLQTIAQLYLQKNSLAKNFRFDIISVLPSKIEQFKNVTIDFT